MTVVYNTVMEKSIILDKKKGSTSSADKKMKISGEWYDLHEMEEQFVDTDITDKLHISIGKELGKLHIRLKNPQIREEYDEGTYTDYGSVEGLQKPEKSSCGLEIVMQRNRGVYLNAKILNLDDLDLNTAVYNSYILLVKVSVKDFVVQVINHKTLECLFNFRFKHLNPPEEDLHMTRITKVNAIRKLQNIQTHVVDAIKNLNSEHLQEQIESNYTRLWQ